MLIGACNSMWCFRFFRHGYTALQLAALLICWLINLSSTFGDSSFWKFVSISVSVSVSVSARRSVCSLTRRICIVAAPGSCDDHPGTSLPPPPPPPVVNSALARSLARSLPSLLVTVTPSLLLIAFRYIGIFFPLWIVALIPIRKKLFPMLLPEADLSIHLDCEDENRLETPLNYYPYPGE